MCWKYTWLNKPNPPLLNTEGRNFPFGDEQGFTAGNYGVCCKIWFRVGLRSAGLSTLPSQINNEVFLTGFDWLLILLLSFFWQGCKWRISSLTIAARAVKAPLLPALWGAQGMSAHIFLLISAPRNYSPVSCNFDLFPFSATCTRKAKIQSRGNTRDVLHPRTTLSTLCFGTEKGGRTITCLSERFGRGKQVSLCSHLCNPGSNWGGYGKVKTDLWFKGRRMVWWLNELGTSLSALADTEHYSERRHVSASVFPL